MPRYRSMSPIRGDVKKNSSPFPLQREIDVVACIQPKPAWMVLLDGFMKRCCSTPSVPEAAQANTLALVGQPWSYLRLEAYSFLGLCKGAYGAFETWC